MTELESESFWLNDPLRLLQDSEEDEETLLQLTDGYDDTLCDQMGRMYSDRSEWQSVQPVAEPEGHEAVCAIVYTDEYRDATDYMRGLLLSHSQSGESSSPLLAQPERALRLIWHIVTLNSGHYSMWTLRRDLITFLAFGVPPPSTENVCSSSNTLFTGPGQWPLSLWQKESLRVAALNHRSPKTFQLWAQRQWITGTLASAALARVEMARVALILDQDGKNYHAWNYRQWLLRTFDAGWTEEDEFTRRHLEMDVRNNSAWAQRFFCVSRGVSFVEMKNLMNASDNLALRERLENEVNFTLPFVIQSFAFESVWLHLHGLLTVLDRLATPPDSVPLPKDSAPALAFWFDVYVAQKDLAKAKQTAEQLQSVDIIRAKYWRFEWERLAA